jgi:hypothetical protein
MRRGYLHLLLFVLFVGGALLNHACSYCSGLDEYDDYTFGGQADAGEGETPDAGGDGGMSFADAGETWWERYDRLSLEATEGCGELTQEQLYCTGGVELDVDLDCPEHCHAVTERHCFCPYKKTYKEAANICRSTGLQLVQIDDGEENQILGGLIKDMGITFNEQKYGSRNVTAAVWIGLNDREQEDTFVWQDGSEAVFKNFALGQPDDLTQPDGEDCVTLHVAENDDFVWYDQPCKPPEGIAVDYSFSLIHFFFCETREANRAITKSSADFLDAGTDGCKIPAIKLYTLTEETCCTTLSDAATGPDIEPGRCGMPILGLCMAFCKPRSGMTSNLPVARYKARRGTILAECGGSP